MANQGTTGTLSLDPQLHRLSLGPQVGRPGDPWSASPFANRPWALPVLVAPIGAGSGISSIGNGTGPQLQLLHHIVAVLLHWFPHRHFTLTGDGGYGSHEMARFAHPASPPADAGQPVGPGTPTGPTPPPVIAGKRTAHRRGEAGKRGRRL